MHLGLLFPLLPFMAWAGPLSRTPRADPRPMIGWLTLWVPKDRDHVLSSLEGGQVSGEEFLCGVRVLALRPQGK